MAQTALFTGSQLTSDVLLFTSAEFYPFVFTAPKCVNMWGDSLGTSKGQSALCLLASLQNPITPNCYTLIPCNWSVVQWSMAFS